jgi:hypothetical protein
MYLLVFHAYIKEMHGSRSKIPTKNLVHIYTLSSGFTTSSIYIHDISRLIVNPKQSKCSKKQGNYFINNFTPQIFFVLSHHTITVYRCLLMDGSLENSCTISLCNLNTTYHLLGRRQTARYVNGSNLQFKSTPLYS